MRSGFNLLFHPVCIVCAAVFFFHPWTVTAYGQSTVASSIDALVEQDIESFVGSLESDGPLLRRLSLDLRLTTPTQHELEEFLADGSPDRWSRWVQRFLDDPLHNERMVDWLDKTLIQRRPFQHVDRASWLSYLRGVIDDRKSLDQIAKDTAGSVWWNRSERAQQRFFLERAGDSHAIARDIGRVFFGRDMQCAQCHDHPQVDDYLQSDYHGLLAFVSSSSFVEAKYNDEKGAEQKLQIYAERAALDAPFESVFDKGALFRTGTRVPGGTESFDPFEAPDLRYQATPMPESLAGAPHPPRFSRRTALVSQFSASNRAFAENWSNRLWALMMGKGLVHPLDMHHPSNPPTNPKLLDALTESLINSGFNMRSLIEQIALSTAYKTSARMPIEGSLRFGSVIQLPPELHSKVDSDLTSRKQSMETARVQLAASADDAKKTYSDAESAWRLVQQERVVAWAELDKSEAAFNEVLKKTDVSKVAFEAAKKLLDDTTARQKLLDEAAGKLEQAKLLGLVDDAELQQAIVTTKSKAEGSNATLPALQMALADATAARDTNQLALDAERGRLGEVAAKLKMVEERLHAADEAFVATRSVWQKAQSEHVNVMSRLSDLSRMQTWMATSQSVRDFEQEHSLAVQTSEESKSRLAKHLANTELLQQQLAETTLARDVVLAAHNSTLEARRTGLAQLELLQAANDSLDKSLTLIKASEPLVAAKQTFFVAFTSTQASNAGMEATLAVNASELAGKSQLFESQTQQLQSAEQTRLELVRLAEQADQAVIAKAQSVQQAIDACTVAMQKVVEERQKSVHLAQIRPLSPEQLCLSILQTTDVLKNYVIAESAELEKQAPMAADATPEQRAARTLLATRQALDKLRPVLDVFANLYSSGVGQTSDEFFASPDQALYMANEGSVFQWSAPSSSNVTGQIVQQPDAAIASKVLYRSLLSRDPTSEEQRWISEMLGNAGDKKPAVAQELVWSLLTSSEFRVYP